MVNKDVDVTASRKVELAIGELASLSVPSCVAVQYLSQALPSRSSGAAMADIIESEPALTAAVLALAQRVGAGPPRQRHAVRLVLDRLDNDALRDSLLSIKVTAGFEIEFAQQPALPSRQDLILHCLATACSASRIAEAAPLDVDPRLAYSAGLLHDLGKLALQDIMPKSLAAIAKEAQATQASLHTVEHKHLGTTHALLGKQLARRWRLPEAITLAIWLHHADPAAVAQRVAEAKTALVVWAADHLARDAGIGQSGSFDPPMSLTQIAEVLGVAPKGLQPIRDELDELVRRKSEALGFDVPHATAKYCDLIQATAADLSHRYTERSAEGRNLHTASSYLDFAQEFLRDVDSNLDAIDIAEGFARRWQRFFQTGTVCLYLAAAARHGAVDAVVVEALGHSFKTVLEVPDDTTLIPPSIAEKYALVEARDHIDWLLGQVATDLDLGRTKLIPLISNGRTVAVMAFELNLPGDAAFFAERFAKAASMAGAVLELAIAGQRLERLSEQLAQIEADQGPTPGPSATGAPSNSVDALAEMAAGVAHELNNPLSVISGRAQLLAQSETDEERQRTLEQIEENARAASSVVDDLMSFAEPSPPRPAKTTIKQILDEALELAGQKTGAEHINAQIDVPRGIGKVLVDSAQIASALANIIANAIESYADTMGPIKITAEPGDEAVTLRISDLGSGMDAETLRKATGPFFSAKPAGRKRGMGLAYAARLIRLNHGSLGIQSQPDQGTTVTVTLPPA